MWRHHTHIPILLLGLFCELFYLISDDGAFGEPHDEAFAHQFIDEKKLQLCTKLAMIALLYLFKHMEVCIKFFFGRKCRPVDAREHFVFFTSSPIGTSD
jgi:hypothetical protein